MTSFQMANDMYDIWRNVMPHSPQRAEYISLKLVTIWNEISPLLKKIILRSWLAK